MTTWISTSEANELSDSCVCDKVFRIKFRDVIHTKATPGGGCLKWDRDAVLRYFQVVEELQEV
jgi:hypothetical protein